MNVISPPSATDQVVLSLLNMFSDPDGAKKAIAAYNEARTKAEAAIAEADAKHVANATRSAELDKMAAGIAVREAAVAEVKKKNAADLAAVSDRETKLREQTNAWDSAVKQANTDASVRDSALGVREKAVTDREAAAEAKMAEATAMKAKHEAALKQLQTIVGAA